MSNGQTYRPVSGIVFAGVVFALAVFTVATLLFFGTVEEILGALAWGTFACSAAWLIFLRPKLEIFDEGVIVTNPSTKISIGWQAVDYIETRYALTFVVGGKKVAAWAATGPGRYHSRNVHRSDIVHYDIERAGMLRPSDSPRAASGEAAILCRARLDSFIQNDSSKGLQGAVKFNAVGVTVLILSLIAGLALNVIHF